MLIRHEKNPFSADKKLARPRYASFYLHKLGKCHLHRRVYRKNIKLMDFPELRHQPRRCHAIAYLPAGYMEEFAKRSTNQTAFGQLGVARHAAVLLPVKNNMFIHFIAQDQNIGVAGQRDQFFDIFLLQNRARWVVRRIEDDHFSARRDQPAHHVPVDAVIRRLQFHAFYHTAHQLYGRGIAIVGRFKNNHFIIWVDGGAN